jgi:uncharacterized protein involved in tellurium resistance
MSHISSLAERVITHTVMIATFGNDQTVELIHIAHILIIHFIQEGVEEDCSASKGLVTMLHAVETRASG